MIDDCRLLIEPAKVEQQRTEDRGQKLGKRKEEIGRAFGRWRVASSSYEFTARREDRGLRSLVVRDRLINQ